MRGIRQWWWSRLTVAMVVALVVAIVVSVTIGSAQADQRLAGASADEQVVPERRLQVAVLGDSITNLTTAELRRRFGARGWAAPVVSGINGIRSDERVTEGPALLRPIPPDVLVIELGTNDVGQFVHDHPQFGPSDLDAFGRSVTDNVRRIAVDAGPSIRCVVVVNVSANTLHDGANRAADAVNRSYDQWDRERPDVVLADWDALVEAEFAAREPNGALTTDLVHPTEYGATRLAGLITTSIDACPAA